jgi:hypothetical protein
MAAIILFCLIVPVLVAAQWTGDQGRRRERGRLYRVTVRDEKSGEERTGFIDRTGKLVIVFDRLPEATKAVGEFHGQCCENYF